MPQQVLLYLHGCSHSVTLITKNTMGCEVANGPFLPLFQVEWTYVIYSSRNQQSSLGSHSCVSLGNLSTVDIASVAFI